MMNRHFNNKNTKSFLSNQSKFSIPETSAGLLSYKVKNSPLCVNRMECRVTLRQVRNPFAFATFRTAVHSDMGHYIDGLGKLRRKARISTASLFSKQGNNVWQNQSINILTGHRLTGEKVLVASLAIYSRIQYFSSCDQSTHCWQCDKIDYVVRAKKAVSLTKRGGHIGHNAASTLQPRLRYPLSSQLLLGKRGTGDMSRLSISVDQAARGLYLVARVLQHGGHVLLIDTRGEASPLQRFLEARASFLPPSLSFSGQHWIGGTLTNWNTISKMVFRCAQISNQFDTFLVSNRVHLPRYEKMRKSYLGFLQHYQSSTNFQLVTEKIDNNIMHKNNRDTYIENKQMVRDNHVDDVKVSGHPDLLLVINPAENRQIIKESERLGIPVVGVVDSNDNLRGITIPVPINPTSLVQPDSFGIRAVQLAIGRECVI